MKTILGIPDALFRILVVFVAILLIALGIRAILPAEMKDSALHRTSTVEHEVAKPLRYAGSETCADCHDEYGIKKRGYHNNLSCETCHGAARAHAENPTDVKPYMPRLREFCTGCHTYNLSRPTGYPMINPSAHNPLKPCISCHNPHDPRPPRTPQECQACHAEIARMKSVSAHVGLECTSCHTAEKEHRLTPRIVKATIPNDRSFCGKCHSKTSLVKDTPKVDLVTHGEKYLCWQCHYPHMPEVE